MESDRSSSPLSDGSSMANSADELSTELYGGFSSTLKKLKKSVAVKAGISVPRTVPQGEETRNQLLVHFYPVHLRRFGESHGFYTLNYTNNNVDKPIIRVDITADSPGTTLQIKRAFLENNPFEKIHTNDSKLDFFQMSDLVIGNKITEKTQETLLYRAEESNTHKVNISTNGDEVSLTLPVSVLYGRFKASLKEAAQGDMGAPLDILGAYAYNWSGPELVQPGNEIKHVCPKDEINEALRTYFGPKDIANIADEYQRVCKLLMKLVVLSTDKGRVKVRDNGEKIYSASWDYETRGKQENSDTYKKFSMKSYGLDEKVPEFEFEYRSTEAFGVYASHADFIIKRFNDEFFGLALWGAEGGLKTWIANSKDNQNHIQRLSKSIIKQMTFHGKFSKQLCQNTCNKCKQAEGNITNTREAKFAEDKKDEVAAESDAAAEAEKAAAAEAEKAAAATVGPDASAGSAAPAEAAAEATRNRRVHFTNDKSFESFEVKGGKGREQEPSPARNGNLARTIASSCTFDEDNKYRSKESCVFDWCKYDDDEELCVPAEEAEEAEKAAPAPPPPSSPPPSPPPPVLANDMISNEMD